jgi:crotonobetainyl-CoA:carnitine CoA-transferase CaiB-like acyl-CoA transferase
MLLADLGAEVTKVERPGVGDQSRAWGPPFVSGETTYFMSTNRGKRSVTADVSDPRGLDVVRRLAGRADVIVENFLPGGAERLGLGRDQLVSDRPEVVYCSIRGYPAESPDATRPGFDFAIQGDGGIMSITGDPDGAPMKVGVAIVDITTGMFAATGILAALLEARVSGRARHVSVSLFDAQLAWLGNRGSEVLIAGEATERFGNAHPSLCPYETFRAADGYVNLAVGTDGQFAAFCTAAAVPQLAGDPRFANNASRVANRALLVAQLQELFATRSVGQWLTLFGDAGVPGGPIRTISQIVAASPWALTTHQHATAGPVRTFRSPISLDGVHETATRPPPTLGEHTGLVLTELGYSAAERDALLAGPCRSG